MPILEAGITGFWDAAVDLNSDTIHAVLLCLAGRSDTHLKPVTGATNADPIVLTITGHGWSNGDLILVAEVGGNLAANGIWKIANQDTNSVELTNPVDDDGAVGSGAFTTDGYAINLSQLDFYDDIDAALVDAVEVLTSPTIVDGIFDSANPTFGAVAALTGSEQVDGVLLKKSTGAAATDRCIFLDVGRHIVTVNTLLSSGGTTLLVEPLEAGILDNEVLTFSNGASATVNGTVAAGARSITVDATAANIIAGARAFALKNVSVNFPITPNGGDISLQVASDGWFNIPLHR